MPEAKTTNNYTNDDEGIELADVKELPKSVGKSVPLKAIGNLLDPGYNRGKLLVSHITSDFWAEERMRILISVIGHLKAIPKKYFVDWREI